MPVEYNKSGIRFHYPDNWELEVSADSQMVTVYSPGGGFWAVSRHTRLADTKELAHAAVDAIRGEYAESEVEEVNETLAGHELVGFDISFYYADLINSASVRALRADRSTFTIFYQAEDREFGKLLDVFQAMGTNFLQNLPVGNFLD